MLCLGVVGPEWPGHPSEHLQSILQSIKARLPVNVLNAGAAPDPAALVARIQAGDPNAETELVERYSRGLRVLIHHNGGHFAVDDLVQDTFRLVLKKIRAGEVRQPERLAEFIRGVGRNLAHRQAQKARARPETGLEAAEFIADPAPSPYDRLLRKEEIELAQQVLEQLPQARDREVLRRFYGDGEDKEQICAALGLTVPQLNQVLSRARRRFLALYARRRK